MDFDFRSGEISLQHNQPIRLNGAKDLRIICTDGKVWITDAKKAGDTFLDPGQSYHIDGTGLVLVESFGAGKIRLVTPPRHSVWQRMQARTAKRGHYYHRIALSGGR